MCFCLLAISFESGVHPLEFFVFLFFEKKPDASFCFFAPRPVLHNLFCAELMHCPPASGKNRSLVYFPQRVPDCQSCDGPETCCTGLL